MVDWATAIKVGAELAGGLIKGHSPGKTTHDNIRNMAAGARKWGEAYGFNPVTLLGVSGSAVASEGGPSFGDAIARAGAALSEGISEQDRQKLYAQKLEAQNEELRKSLEKMTLRPVTPGVFDRAAADRAAAGATGKVVPDAVAASGVVETPSMGGTIIPRMGAATEPKTDPRYPNYIDPDTVQASISPLYQGYMAPGGEVLYSPEGPDSDELVTGFALDALLRQRAVGRTLRATDTELMRFDPYHRDGYVRPVRFGGN